MSEFITGAAIPASHRDLLEQPLYGHLATIRPQDCPILSHAEPKAARRT